MVLPASADHQKFSAPAPRTLITRPDPHAKPRMHRREPGLRILRISRQARSPEQVFARKKFYKMLVNMPN